MKRYFVNSIIYVVIILIIAVMWIFALIIIQETQSASTSIETPQVFENEFEYAEEKTTNSLNVIDNDDTKTVENISAPKIISNPLDEIKSASETAKKEVTYNNVTIDKFFYNQLDEYSKTIYKAFEANKENMKSGTYKVDLGSSFSSLLDKENGQEALGKCYQTAIEAYTYDNPQIFYLNPNKMYLIIETKSIAIKKLYTVYISNGEESNNYLNDTFTSKAQVDAANSAVEQVKNRILQNRKSTNFENIKMVHDYLVDNISYDTSVSKPNIYNIYGALVNKEAVCEGYARAFKYLMDELGIPCTLVIGKGTNSHGQTENHAWNYVQLNGIWYAIDCTWDDPIISGGGTINDGFKYKYFLKGSNDINKDHIASNQFTEGGKVFNYPVISNTNYEF